jgi:hypothetical protein
MMFQEILDGVPDYREYLTYDELSSSSQRLAKENPKTVRLLKLGESRAGRPIDCLKIGEGKHHALIYGFPNPEEPVGGLLIDYFSQKLAESVSLLRELDYTWYFVKCIDPDGAKLNEGFLKGPLTPYNFAMNYYRTPEQLAGEENFPYRFGDIDFNNPVPETKALMKIMDQTSLDFISGLHNMKWGGITYQVSDPCPRLYAPLQDAAKAYNIFLRKRLGTMLAQGIQLAGYFTPARNFAKAKAAGKGPLQQITGAYSFEYAQMMNPRVFMMIPECSVWFDPRCYDDKPSGQSWKEILDAASKVDNEANNFLVGVYEKAQPILRASSPFLEMINSIVREIKTPTINVLDPGPELGQKELEREATVAEKTETEGRADIYRLFNLGVMIRALDHELSHQGKGNAGLQTCRNDAMNKLEEWRKELNSKYDCRMHPIRNLVAMNLASTLYSAEYAKWKSQNP